MIDQVVGSYRVISQLGAGGMGSVWLAEHTLLGNHVAIKFLLPEMSQNQSVVERFFAEARAATKIADPGIVVVHDFGWHTDGSAYLVMEHLRGASLTARLAAHGRLAPLDALRIVQQAAIAMAVAHGAGIIHRDLKPDNLFLVPDPAVDGGERTKILDFGIAKLVGQDASVVHTRTGAILGTPTYMSPEQCRGSGGVDHRTDIYALGCVLFHLVVGRPPFLASTPGDMIAAHLREAPAAPSALVPELPAVIDAVVLRCLAKSPDERCQTMTELAREIAVASGSLTPSSTIPPRGPRPGPHARGGIPDDIATPPPVATTLASSAGESLELYPRPRRTGRSIGIAVVGVVVAATIAIVIVMVSSGEREVEAPPGPAAEPISPGGTDPAVDAAEAGDAVVDATNTSAADAAVPIDASTSSRHRRPPARPPPARRPPRTTGSAAGGGSGSGSGSGDYDPYENR